jgi:glutamyl-tRNA synthetase
LPGAQEQQLADLKTLGMVPDEILVQSQRHLRHWQLFQKAIEEGAVYPCFCSRKEIQEALEGLASAPHLALGSSAPLYSGKCRPRECAPSEARRSGHSTVGWRFRSHDPSGAHDFIVARTAQAVPDQASFTPAYHWACAIDDDDGAYDLLVRAADLSSATPIQREIQVWLARAQSRPPRFAPVFHTSLVLQNDGHRLEKRTQGVTLPELISQGITPAQLVAIFERSFNLSEVALPIRPEAILGEARESIGLRDLKAGVELDR